MSSQAQALALGLSLGVGLGMLLQRVLAQRSLRREPMVGQAPPASSSAAVPDEQLNPSEFEAPDADDRLLRRIETVVQRRTSRVIMVLERLCDGHNYAAVLRTCESLGIQHVWMVAPPKRDDLFESAVSGKREYDAELMRKEAEKETRRQETDLLPTPGSRRNQRRLKRLKAATTFCSDAPHDEEHAAFARRAARFLSLRTFDTASECLRALEADGRRVWATDLGQEAVVLAPGAAWLDEPEALPDRLAVVIGTEATGVSREMLDAAHRRVYLPQNGFADSLNASVAAALTLQTVLLLYGERACGDLAREAAAGELDRLRLEWMGHLARDAAHLASMAKRLHAMPPALHDMRRHAAFREHTGRLQRKDRRMLRNQDRALQQERQNECKPNSQVPRPPPCAE